MADINVEIINPPVFEISLSGKGPQGLRGERGPQGPQGETGATGPQGPKGDKGDTALTFSIGKVEELPTDQPPYVEDVGSDGNIVLDFGLPKGSVGPSGRGVGLGAISLSLSKVPSEGFLHTWGETISQEDNLDLYQACVDGTLPTINASNGGVTTIYAPNGIFKETSGTNTLELNEDVVMELAKIGGVVNWNAVYNTKPTGITLASFRQNVETQVLMFTEGGLNETYFRFIEGPYSGSLPEAPSNPVNNTLYFNTTDKTYYIFEGGYWNQYGAEGVGYIYLGAIMVLTEPSTATWDDVAFLEAATTTTGLSQYDLELANNNGNCGYFGLDTLERSVRVPTLHDVFLKEDETNVGHYTPITINQTPSTDGYISLYYYVCVDKYTSLEQGPYFIPSVGADGVISWTNNGGLVNPTPRNITGPRGATGNGITGVTLLSTVGLEKTYRMTFSDGSYFDYVVSDGAKGSYIGQFVFSILPQIEAGLHLLDGNILNGNGIYKGFVDYIKDLYTDSPTASYFTTETDWQASVTQYGVCGKFVYNSSANTVRLPKVTGIIEGTIDASALGDLVEAGLPAHTHTRGDMNITGSLKNSSNRAILWDVGANVTASGAFTASGSGRNSNAGENGTGTNTISFDASNSWTGSTSNPNYTADINTTSTVQPQTIKGYYYIVVATTSKTDIEVDIDNVVTDLNGKVNKSGDTMTGGLVIRKSGAAQLQLINTSMNKATPPASTQYNQLKFVDNNNQDYGFLQCRQLSNNSYLIELGVKHQSTSGYTTFALGCDANGNGYVVASGAVKQYMAQMPMPSSRYTDLTLGASGTTYTAPANGWFYIDKYAGSSGKYVGMRNQTAHLNKQSHASTNGDGLSVYIPVSKNDIVEVSYNATGATNAFRFIYAQGEQ